MDVSLSVSPMYILSLCVSRGIQQSTRDVISWRVRGVHNPGPPMLHAFAEIAFACVVNNLSEFGGLT